MSTPLSRRTFTATAAAAAAPLALASNTRPALLGGAPVYTGKYPSWPVFDQREEAALAEVIRSGAWFRGYGKKVDEFETAYAKFTGAKACVTTVNGTNSLFTALNVMGVKAGDEVIVPPFTFVASFNVIIRQHALPVFADIDPDTFLLDPAAMNGLANERTRAVLPVHIGGACADMDGINAFARKHQLGVLEDACQAWTAQWRGRNVGRIGRAGCFSFQASKNLNAGEGGAIISDDEEFIDQCHAFHDQGRSRRGKGYAISGSNLRLSEFHAAVLLVQLSRLEEQVKVREANAAYLDSLLREVPGVRPAKSYPGATRNAYHLYMMHYDAGSVRRPAAREIPQSHERRRHPLPRRLRLPSQLRIPLRTLPKDRAFRALFGEKTAPRMGTPELRPAALRTRLPGACLVRPERAAGRALRDGPHRRSRRKVRSMPANWLAEHSPAMTRRRTALAPWRPRSPRPPRRRSGSPSAACTPAPNRSGILARGWTEYGVNALFVHGSGITAGHHRARA
jgi:perosamine synthetase